MALEGESLEIEANTYKPSLTPSDPGHGSLIFQ